MKKSLMVTFLAAILLTTIGFISRAYSDSYTYITIEVPGSLSTEIYGINNDGHIVGLYNDAETVPHNFVYNGIDFTTIQVPGTDLDQTIVHGINDLGQIVGSYWNNSKKYGFIYDGSTYTTVEVPGSLGTEIYGINNDGHIVGLYNDAETVPHSFVYNGIDFTTIQLSSDGLDQTMVHGINDLGQIVGNYRNNSRRYGFIASLVHDLRDGLIAYYPFNGNANDESGNGHHGTACGSTLAPDRFGNEGMAYSFDGIDDTIEVLPHPELNPGTDSFSYCFWVRTSEVDNVGYMIGRYDHDFEMPDVWKNKTWGIQFLFDEHDEDVNGLWGYFRDGFSLETGSYKITENWAIADGEFHFIAAVRNRIERKVKYYIDGRLSFEYEDPSSTITVNSSLIMGTHGNWGKFFEGVLDDIRIYNRALSKDEIQRLYDLCEGDFDGDCDVDGSDLAVFAADFGRTDCNDSHAAPCRADFDNDGNVDGSDLAVFASDFGRTDCLSPW